jgi:hypothetical protein
MTKLLDRLRGYDLQLIPPISCTQKQTNPSLSDIQQFRASVYREFAYIPADDLVGDPNNADLIAWQLVISRSEQIIGCIRFMVFDPSEAVELPARIIAYTGCKFSPTDHKRCLSALAAYIQTWQTTGNPLVLVGGLAVAGRQTMIGAALCLAGNAFARLTGSSTGLVFATTMMGKAKLYTKAGCRLLPDVEGPLGTLYDNYHSEEILVMAANCWDNEPELEPSVVALYDLLSVSYGTYTNSKTICKNLVYSRSPQNRLS